VALPSVPPEHTWLAEGLATYVEPIARARAGLVSRERVWGDLVDGLPRGAPRPGDGGLVGARDFGRVYWGGALYFLLADLGVRERTNGKRSLDDALRAIVATGENGEATWTLDRFLGACERATETRIFRELYEELAVAGGTRDLAALFARLGVSKEGATVRLDDRAPFAKVRDAITASH
jgi:predicted metalloprotease with PDZ domain